MFRLIVITSVLACVYSASIPTGLVPMLDGRIVGGKETTIEEFPHQVSLRYNGRHRCGGSIYSKRIVISAAHCVHQLSTRNLKIVAGATALSEKGSTVQVEKFYVHDDYQPYTLNNDVSVLILSRSLVFGDLIQPIPLQEANTEVDEGTIALVSGWGALYEGGYSPDNLQYVEVSVFDSKSCNRAYDGRITSVMICAGNKRGGKDACQGDSGGPLIAEGKLIGIVSWGYGCARPQYPGVYSKVSRLHKWIMSKIQ